MNGKVGAVFAEGRQIGGFFNWAFKADYEDGKYKGWRGSAYPYWWFEEYEGPAGLRFYLDDGSLYYTTVIELAKTHPPFDQYVDDRIILSGTREIFPVKVEDAG